MAPRKKNISIPVEETEVPASPAEPAIIKVKGQRQNLAKTTRNPKQKKSTFHLTINSNQCYALDDQNLDNDIGVFEGAIEDILQHIDQYVKLPEGDNFHDKVLDADIDYVIERGSKRGQIHTHILLRFKHNTKLLLDYGKIKEKLKEELGIDVYMYNRLVNNGSDNVMDYLTKHV